MNNFKNLSQFDFERSKYTKWALKLMYIHETDDQIY